MSCCPAEKSGHDPLTVGAMPQCGKNLAKPARSPAICYFHAVISVLPALANFQEILASLPPDRSKDCRGRFIY
ncbi:hypothetical protein ASD31_06435 [Rhizobium sp. Root482]|nr:hypothetical protein ASD31_06435 [Rhizobium sp. Root482]